MKKIFYSNGKLLITGEYVVLDGAQALAVSTRFGQSLVVQNSEEDQNICWKSYDKDGTVWFEDNIFFSSIIQNEITGNTSKIKSTLIKILHEAYLLNPVFLQESEGYYVSTSLTFPRNWGLGTSSTLINNIAQWTEVDAFLLLKNSFGGSGYDIACAQNNSPILYQLINHSPRIQKVDFLPSFQEHIYFVYLNQKQNSQNEINNYTGFQKNKDQIVSKINELTEVVLNTKDQTVFCNALEEHELILSQLLKRPTVKKQLFPDFNGTIKSLGAWGGDFVMVVSSENPMQYFKEKGYNVLLNYKEMIL